MKQFLKAFIALLLAAICAFSAVPVVFAYTLEAATATDAEHSEPAKTEPEHTEPEVQKLEITGPAYQIHRDETIQLTANKSGVRWSTSKAAVATVDQNGKVKGNSIGKVIIYAEKNGEKAEYKLSVIRTELAILTYLSKHNVLSYKYSYDDDYYYVDAPNAWQRNFGFNKIYDLVAPYILLEYDYVRVHFEYEGKDWMIQIWKGQYGLVFFGGEVGVYNKPHSDKEDTAFTTYSCAPEEDWLNMQTTLYRDERGNGEYRYLFATDYEKTWWSTGFKPGHLRQQEPAIELRQTGTITLKDKEMTEAFSKGLMECGFKCVEKCDEVPLDSFYIDGNDVVYAWQNLSYAENTMPIKITAGTALFLNFAAFSMLLLGLATFIGIGMLGLIVLFVI